MNICIRNGRLIDPARQLDTVTDLYVADGRIAALDQAPAGFASERTLDAEGLVVCPGLIDLSARLREPGFEYRATLESEMAAAMAGGITSLAIPPDTDPPLDEPGLVEMLCHRARQLHCAHIYPVGALTVGLGGTRLSEMSQLRDAGCIAFGQANTPILDTSVLLRAMQYAATFGFAVWLQPTTPHLSAGGVAHDGETATRLGLPGIPVEDETIALYTYLELARRTGVRLHVTRLSSAAGLHLIEQARTAGIAVSCDISINQLHLRDRDIGYFDSNCHLFPPLRDEDDRLALRGALELGRIDALCSDHTPVDDDNKLTPFAESAPGATGLELLLPLTLKWAQEQDIPLAQALARVTSGPARLAGITKAGHLGIGARADLCLFEPGEHRRLSRDMLRSQGRNTPFIGHELPGRVHYTLVEGRIMFERG